MSITITTIDADERDEWNEHVSRSPQGTVFHQYEALETFASHSNSILHPLIGYKGQEPIGLFPVFELHKGPVRFAFSPPHELHVPNLGPALLGMEQMKQRKREKRHERFVEGCLEWLDRAVDPHYVSIRAGWRYDDVRPFKWNAFDVQPSYTYVLTLGGDEEELIGRFSKSARRHVRNNLDEAYVVEEGGTDAIEWIVSRIRERYAEQGKTPTITAALIAELYERLPEGQVRPYVLTIEGEIVTGVILLEYNEMAHSWQGGAKPGTDLPANDLLEWHMLTDAMDRGATTYEIVDANTPRLNEYKTKFGPEVRSYYTMKRTAMGMDAAVSLYLTLRDRSEFVTTLRSVRNIASGVTN